MSARRDSSDALDRFITTIRSGQPQPGGGYLPPVELMDAQTIGARRTTTALGLSMSQSTIAGLGSTAPSRATASGSDWAESGRL